MQSRKRFILIVAGAVALLSAGIASAAWLANGSGNGYATSATAQNLTTNVLSGSGITSTQLYPGIPGANGEMTISINNPNPYSVDLTSIQPSGGATIVSGGGSGCSNANHGVSFTGSTVSAGTRVVPPGTSVIEVTGVTMATTSHTDCQGVTFAIPVTMTGTSA